MIPFYSTLAKFVDISTGRILNPWIQYLQQFTVAPANIMPITVSASPFSYTVKEPGNIIITGGAITSITLVRGSTNLDMTGQKVIPVGIKDIVIVIYTIIPTIKFIPSYGQNTTS